MNKKQKILLISIIVIFIIIISILILIINIKDKEKINDSNYNVTENQEETPEAENDYIETEKQQYNLKYIDNSTEYFTINSIVSYYLSLLNEKQVSELEKTLAPNFMIKYNINSSNILNIQDIPKTEDSSDISLFKNEILTTEIDGGINIYIINGTSYNRETKAKVRVLVMLEVDKQNQLYNLYPYKYVKDNGFDKLKFGDKFSNYTKEDITDREYNMFIFKENIDDKKISQEYFKNYSKLLEYYPEEAYNRLDSEYKSARYKSLEAFKEYVSKISYTIYTMNINKYKVHKTDNYTDYLCTDQYNNYYIFREKDGIMNYTVFLDSYTVDLDVFKENYEKASDEEKVSLNVGKFKQMLNTKDYNTIYNKLNETFRKNNFSTVSKLEEYLKKNTYEINSIKVENKNQQNDYYVCECTLVDQTNTEQTKKMTIMIKLLDNNNFSMSFSIK